MKEQKPTNAELLVMITTLTELVIAVIQESRCLYRFTNGNGEVDTAEKLIKETGRRAEQMSELVFGVLDQVEQEHKATAKKEEQ